MLICDRYDATGTMKAGGMSQAHICNDVHLNRKVVLKVLQSEQEERRLEDEKKALMLIRSNHVVQLLDIAEFESLGKNYSCLVLEYIEGKDFEEGSCEEGELYLSYLWQVAKGLEEIHSSGLVHRDIKPDNVRLDSEGIVKIIDFGLSREVGVDNKTISAVGYYPYMAPELLNPPVEFTAATDVYSFGVFALAIAPDGLPGCLTKAIGAPAPSSLVADHLNDTPVEIVEILQRCLSSTAGDRPAMGEIVEALERVLLAGRHMARISIGGTVSEVSQARPKARPKISNAQGVISQIDIEYNGFDFVVTGIIGQVDINNRKAKTGDCMPASCVLAFHHPYGQLYATFDVSNPEFIP